MLSGVDQHARFERVAVLERPRGQPHLHPGVRGIELSGQLSVQLTSLGCPQRRAERLAVERVAYAEAGRADGVRSRQQPAGLQLTRALERIQPGEQLELGGLGEDDQRQRASLSGRQRLDALIQQVEQASGWWDRPRAPPVSMLDLQAAAVDPGADQLAEEQRVAGARLPQPSLRPALDRRPEQSAGDVDSRVLVERLQVHPQQPGIFPQRRHRVGGGRAGAHRCEHPDAVASDGLQEQRGGRRVEPVGVVDDHDEHPAVCAVREARPGAAQNLEHIAGHPGYRPKQLGEGAEGYGRCRLGGEHQLDRGAARTKPPGQSLGRVALSDPSVAENHRAAASSDRLLRADEHVPAASPWRRWC